MILCIDSSANRLVMALWDNEKQQLKGELLLDASVTHGQMLMPAIDFLLQQSPGELSALALCVGPGSFTGLRVGMATVQGLAFALNLPVVRLSSLEVIAANQGPVDHTLWAVMDGRQKMVYAASFFWQNDKLERLSADGAAHVKRLSQIIEAPAYLVGSGAMAYAHELQTKGVNLLLAATPRGEVLARLASQALARGEQVAAEVLRPNYCRPSEAESRFGLPLEDYNLL